MPSPAGQEAGGLLAYPSPATSPLAALAAPAARGPLARDRNDALAAAAAAAVPAAAAPAAPTLVRAAQQARACVRRLCVQHGDGAAALLLGDDAWPL